MANMQVESSSYVPPNTQEEADQEKMENVHDPPDIEVKDGALEQMLSDELIPAKTMKKPKPCSRSRPKSQQSNQRTKLTDMEIS